MRYDSLNGEQRKSKSGAECFFTFDEFLTAFEKHKSIYGMKSAWGPGPDQLDQHLPITMIHSNNPDKKAKKNPKKSIQKFS